MPCGATTILWATCEKCEENIQSDTDQGGRRGAVEFARLNGWLVRRNGQAFCPDCRKTVKQEKKEAKY